MTGDELERGSPFLITLELEGPAGPALVESFVCDDPSLAGFEKGLTILGLSCKLTVRFDPPLVPVELELELELDDDPDADL